MLSVSQEREFRQIATVEQAAFHFVLEGNLLHVDSDEGRRQLARQSKTGAARPPPVEEAHVSLHNRLG